MIDLESMIKSLRLAWLKRIFGENDGAWKSYLPTTLLKRHGGLLLFYCNYDIKDYFVPSLFYSELLQCCQNSETFMILQKKNGNI